MRSREARPLGVVGRRRHAASPQQMGRMGGSLLLTSLGPCRGQQAPGGGSWTAEPCEVGRVGEAGSQAPASLPDPSPWPHFPLQEAILISLAALQPGLTQAGARPS